MLFVFAFLLSFASVSITIKMAMIQYLHAFSVVYLFPGEISVDRSNV